jgi:lipopolysaccharide export system permease protein
LLLWRFSLLVNVVATPEDGQRMKTLDRYVGLAVASNFLFALAALLAVFSVINLTQELKDVRSGQYGVGQALLFVVMTLPTEAYKLFPAAALLGGVNGLGMLASRNELVAISAAGVSRARLTWSVMQAASCLMVAAVLLGEFVAAPLAQHARTQRSVVVSGGSVLTTVHGVWTRDRSRFVNIRTPLFDDALQDLYVYDFDDRRRMTSFTYVQTASYTNQQWRLEGLVESRITEDAVTTQRVPVRMWDTFLNPKQLRVLFLPPDDLSLFDLYRSIGSLRQRGENPRRHQLAFWRRITMPIVTGIMVFLAIPFILTGLRTLALGQRIVAGALLGIGFQMFNDTFGRFGLVYGLDPALSAIFPGALVLAASLSWLHRAHW